MEYDHDRFNITGTTIKTTDTWLWIKIEGKGAMGLLKASMVTGACTYAGDMILEDGWKTVSFNFSCSWSNDSEAGVEEESIVALARRLDDRRTQLKTRQLEERVRALSLRLDDEMNINAALNLQLHLTNESK